jgi:hypothetical protein
VENLLVNFPTTNDFDGISRIECGFERMDKAEDDAELDEVFEYFLD